MNKLIKKFQLFSLVLSLTLVTQVIKAQVTITTSGNYTQNFDALINTGTATWTDNSTIANWYSQRSGTGTTIIAGTGSGNTGGLYSFGSAGSSERALGSVGSNNVAAGGFAHGVQMLNSSGNTVTDVRIGYTLEQWRNYGGPSAHQLYCYYKISSTPITSLNPPDSFHTPSLDINATNGWTMIPALTLVSPITSGTTGALDGNATANRVSVSGISIPGLSLANNQYLMIKWDDSNHVTADHGLSIDDVSIDWTVSAATNPVINATAVNDFGNVVILTNSASQTITVTGSNLTGAPGNITITSPSTDFQVSNNNITWGQSTSIQYTSATLAARNIYVRFTPQTIGPKSGNVTLSGGGITTAVTVAVSGNGISASTASITSSALNAFGNVCLNLSAGPNSFTLTGNNLSASDITVGPLNGFTFSTSSGGPYTSSLTLTHAAGAYSQMIYVNFNPTTSASYNGNIVINGGGITSAVNVVAQGTGVNSAPSLNSSAASTITQNSATISGVISSNGCSTISAYGFEYSTTNGFTPGTGTRVNSTNLIGAGFSYNLTALNAGTTYYYVSFATNAGGTSYGNQLNFTTVAGAPANLTATNLLAFGSVCVNTTAGPNSFDLTGSNLSAATVTVGPLSGYSFATSVAGPFSSLLAIAQTGGNFNQTVYVNFNPNIIGSFDGNIPVNGGGITSVYYVAVSGSGSPSGSSVATLDSTDILQNSVVLHGAITSTGCSAITEYGIEYSGVNGFTPGFGIKVSANNLNNNAFSSQVNGLVQNSVYYYRAYAKNAGGITYGEQKFFVTNPIYAGLIIYSTPAIRGNNVRYSLSGIKPSHYTLRVFNMLGQIVFQKDMNVQVDFIDDNFIVPGSLPVGLYTLQIANPEFRIQKPLIIQ
jgi:hypothetical protein